MSAFDQRCINCRFYDPEYTEEKHGQCLRYPPQVVHEYDNVYWRVPEVFELYRCGEWRPVLESEHISAYDEEFTKD